MFISQLDFQLLTAVLVLLRPLCIVFPLQLSAAPFATLNGRAAYFMISLSLMMRLISAIKVELTHTTKPSDWRALGLLAFMRPYFLCESKSRYGSWSCLRSEQSHYGHLQRCESRTLEVVSNHGTPKAKSRARSITKEFMTKAA